MTEMTEETSVAIEPTAGILEAVLFAAGDPIRLDELQHVLDTDLETVEDLLQQLERNLAERGSGLTIRRVAGGIQLATRPDTYQVVERLAQVVDRKISAPTMETLSIVAFKQPITKQEIEQIRGVRVERALAKLVELEFIHEVGRKQVIGRPILYGTTETFLRCFGLDSLEELPPLPSDAEAAEGMNAEELELLHEVEQAGQSIGQQDDKAFASGEVDEQSEADEVPD